MAITRPSSQQRPAPPRTTRTPSRGAPGWPAPALGLAWALFIGATFVLAPDSDPNAPVALWSDLLMLAFNLALVTALVGLFSRRRWSFGASGVASIFGMGVAVACAVTDHHLGIYWAYELMGFTALGLASGVARLHA